MLKNKLRPLTQKEIAGLIVLIILLLIFLIQVNVYLVEFGWYHG